MSDKEARDLQLQAEFSALDNEISQLTQELKSGQKALDEGVGVFEAIHLKHQRDVNKLLKIPIQLLTNSLSYFSWKNSAKTTRKYLNPCSTW